MHSAIKLIGLVTAFGYAVLVTSGSVSSGLITSGSVWTGRACAKEPYERFLQRLRDEQLFDLALLYLDDLSGQSGIGPKFKADLELERGMLQYMSAAVLPPSDSGRAARLDAAERSLREFLVKKTNHPRRGEARLKLGELLLTRAEEAKAQADENEDNAEAIKFYQDAHQLFETTIGELAGILERIKGARTDANDSEKVAYRTRVQQDLRQAQLLSAKSVEERGLSRAKKNPQRTADLRKALKMFSDLYAKEQRMVGIRNYALFYRSEIQALLDMPDDAIDGYQRIADLEPIDALRPLQSGATTELVKLLAGRGKFPLAVERAEQWLSSLRADERTTPEALELQLELAKVKVAWSEQLKQRDPNDRVASRLVRDTRSEIRTLLRTPGAHLDEARELLGKLGVELDTSKDTEELPQVKDFAEALAEAQQRIDQAETDSLSIEVLRKADGSTEEIAQVQNTIDVSQQQALTLLRDGVRLFGPDDDRDQLFEAQYRIAFLLIKQQQPWEAIAVGEFLARQNPRTDKGLRSAAVVLNALNSLLLDASQDDQAALIALLEPFAEYLVATWPQSEEAAASAAALVQLALQSEQWDKAEEFLKLVPDTGDAVVRLRRYAGVLFYSRYNQEAKRSGPDSEASRELRQLTLSSLEVGTQGLTDDQLDASAIEAINARARLLLAEERLDEASELLTGKVSPIKAIEADADVAPPTLAMEVYRTALQLIIGQLGTGQLESQQATDKTAGYIAKLQQLAKADAGGQSELSSIFVGLASDLKTQLAGVKEAPKRKRLSEALVLVAAEAAKSEAFNTQYWAADTLISISTDLLENKGNRSVAMKSLADADQILQGIMSREANEPGWIQPPGLKLQIRLLLAKVASGMGNHKAAVAALAEILSENINLLDVQIEAARAYQAWGDASNSGFHKAAVAGGRPNPKTGEKLIWGWGKISQRLAGNPKFESQFYESRYQLARSRYKYAVGLKQAEQQQQEVRRAENDIISTASLFPDLGGPEMKKRYDALLKVIQKRLGKPTQGLAAIGKK